MFAAVTDNALSAVRCVAKLIKKGYAECHTLQLCVNDILKSSGVLAHMSPDLWLDKHVTAVNAKCFFSPATTASSSSSLARLRLSSDIGARLRHQSG